MTARIIDPSAVAADYRSALRQEIAALPTPLHLLGLISGSHGPAETYAEYTRKACSELGVDFQLKHVARLEAAGAWVLPSNAQAARAAACIAGEPRVAETLLGGGA